ncbi:TetR family transcriptional regulator [Streptomyces sp. NPDC059566]|uniref:TetR family transcriptional regulator n=1 Tax=Streptomyces sp. NPDC059566 TaxID=3346866 RepID=UPI0036775BE1
MVKQERAARTREALVRAAAEVFAEEGFTAASIAVISRRARVSAGGLHFHFAGKTVLARAVQDRAAQALSRITAGPAVPPTAPASAPTTPGPGPTTARTTTARTTTARTTPARTTPAPGPASAPGPAPASAPTAPASAPGPAQGPAPASAPGSAPASAPGPAQGPAQGPAPGPSPASAAATPAPVPGPDGSAGTGADPGGNAGGSAGAGSGGGSLQVLVDSTHRLMALLAHDAVVRAGFALCADPSFDATADLRRQWRLWVEAAVAAAAREGLLAEGLLPEDAARGVVAATVGLEVLGAYDRQWLAPHTLTRFWTLMLPRLASPPALDALLPQGSPGSAAPPPDPDTESD